MPEFTINGTVKEGANHFKVVEAILKLLKQF